MSISQNLEAALSFVQTMGAHVFPARGDTTRKTHKPLTKWSRDPNGSSADPATIATWAARWPECYFCVNLGASGLAVLDVDRKYGVDGAEALAKHVFSGRSIPQTYLVETPSGGFHYIFEGADLKNTVGVLGPGLDTRGAGGMVPVPGTVVPGKGAYRILDARPPEPLPTWIPALAGEAPQKSAKNTTPVIPQDLPSSIHLAREYLTHDAPEAVQGNGGDATTYGIACHLVRDLGLSEDTALELLAEHWNPVKAIPPWALDELRVKIRNAARYGQNPPGVKSPAAAFPPPPEPKKLFRDMPDFFDSPDPRIPWVYSRWYVRGYFTMTVAPGGTGKSTFSLLEALAIVTGKPLAGEPVHESGPVWYWSTEDPDDLLELRAKSIARHFGLSREDTRGFYLTGADRAPFVLAAKGPNGPVANDALLATVIETIQARRVKLLILDPFVRCFRGLTENDNGDMDFVAQLLSRIAREGACAVAAVHHTPKRNKDADTNGDQGSVRGAGATAAAARIVRTVNTMRPKEGAPFGIEADECWRYVRLDDAKANLAPRDTSEKWFRLVSVPTQHPGQTVGVLEPASLSPVVKKEDERAYIVRRAAEILRARGGTETVCALARAIADEGRVQIKWRMVMNILENLNGEVLPDDLSALKIVKIKHGTGEKRCLAIT